MKKIILYAILFITGSSLFVSCEKDPIGNTATEQLAGDWYVTADAVDASGNVVYSDVFNLGNFHLDTYNLATNVSDTLWVCDNSAFWDFKVKVPCNVNDLTFGTAEVTDTLPNYAYSSGVIITDGKILKGKATTPRGMTADSIVFNVSFDDDSNPTHLGYDHYRVSGYRYTGFTNDN